MATPPDFSPGQVLTAAHMDAVGLWLVKSQTIGTGVASVTVTDAFSADYDNYRIVVTGVSASVGGQSLYLQLNNSTGTTYSMGGIYGSFGSTTLNGYGPAAATRWTDILALGDGTQGGTIDLFSPQLATPTTMTTMSTRQSTGANSWYFMAGLDTSTAQSTGFTLGPIGAGTTITGGTIRVYGYRN